MGNNRLIAAGVVLAGGYLLLKKFQGDTSGGSPSGGQENQLAGIIAKVLEMTCTGVFNASGPQQDALVRLGYGYNSDIYRAANDLAYAQAARSGGVVGWSYATGYYSY